MNIFSPPLTSSLCAPAGPIQQKVLEIGAANTQARRLQALRFMISSLVSNPANWAATSRENPQLDGTVTWVREAQKKPGRKGFVPLRVLLLFISTSMFDHLYRRSLT